MGRNWSIPGLQIICEVKVRRFTGETILYLNLRVLFVGLLVLFYICSFWLRARDDTLSSLHICVAFDYFQ